MVKVDLICEEIFSIQINNLSVIQVKFLMGVFQNSPMGYSNPDDEPRSEFELRKAIFDACKRAFNG